MKHVDEWLDEPAANEVERKVKEWLEHFRQPAADKDYAWLDASVLTCLYRGELFRCTGASRLGDLWLTRDLKQSTGYELRVDVAECSGWSVNKS